jgi:hypothetical protein
MAVDREEFKFPDEIEAKAEQNQEATDDIQVEIEDDTPPEDRGRVPMPKEVVEELDNDDLEEYSEKVKKRLSQMKKVWHDERREKERAIREREEALRFAQMRDQELRQVKEKTANSEKVFIREATRYAESELVLAKERLKQAYETGDSEQIMNAQDKLTDAKLRVQSFQRYQPSLQKQEERVEQNQQVPAYQPSSPEPQVDPKAAAWRDRNTWFGTDEEMTALALGLHEKLVRSGVDPRSDEYYRRVDDTMRKRFPEAFDDAEDEQPQTKQAQKPARTKPANVVAPVTRGTAPRQVRLTPTQVAIAKKLGLSNEQYAREVMKLEAN